MDRHDGIAFTEVVAMCPRSRRSTNPPEQRRALYGSRRWKLARASYLKAHPWCAHCGCQATVVDHLLGHSGDWWRRFWDEHQWQPLCAKCHGRKTIAVDAVIDGAQQRRYRAGFVPPRAHGQAPGGREGEKVGASPPTSAPSRIYIRPASGAGQGALPLDSSEFLAHRLRARAASPRGTGS